ncbi:MAG: hypothetical protein NZ108_01130, partial [Bacteroidia bacterium]|nr:hypothetical protein [Bacteroidia bacterium]
RFALSIGVDTTDIIFQVRSIDNLNVPDPTPAKLKIPIRNSAPSVEFNAAVYPQDTIYPVLTLNFIASDPDGDETIDSVYLKINEGEWITVEKNVRLVSFIPTNPNSSGTGSAYIYTATNVNPLTKLINGLKVDGLNQVFVKVKDQGGLFSEPDSSKVIYIKRKQSELLVIDTWRNAPRAADVYLPLLNSVYGTYDYIDFASPTNRPAFFNPTLRLLFNLHKEVFWYSPGDSATVSLFDLAESIIQNFLNNGNKLLVVCNPAKNISVQSSLFRITPMDSLTTRKDASLLNSGSLIPDPQQNLYPMLKNTGPGLITGINPFYPKTSAQVLYRAELVQATGQPWQDSTIVGAKLTNSLGKTNLIYIGMPLHRLNGNANLELFFQTIRSEFAW